MYQFWAGKAAYLLEVMRNLWQKVNHWTILGTPESEITLRNLRIFLFRTSSRAVQFAFRVYVVTRPFFSVLQLEAFAALEVLDDAWFASLTASRHQRRTGSPSRSFGDFCAKSKNTCVTVTSSPSTTNFRVLFNVFFCRFAFWSNI